MGIQLWVKAKKVFYWLVIVCISTSLFVFVGWRSQMMFRIVVLEEPHYLCPYFRGGLGNLMFMYASLYGIAQTKGMKLVLNQQDHIITVFPNLKAEILANTSFCETALLVGEVKPCAYNAETFSFDHKKNTRQKAYLQSWKYFENVEQDIRRQFQFTPSVQETATNVIRNHTNSYIRNRGLNKTLEIIGVHIRRGDYLQSHNVKYGYEVVTKAYIDNAFQYFRNKFKECLFLVFTGPGNEDIQWRNENINGNDVVHMPANTRDVDMCALSMCNHTLITVGSFGWWAAWLSKGTTVYFKNVAKENSSLRNDFSKDMSDFFPPTWIGLQ